LSISSLSERQLETLGRYEELLRTRGVPLGLISAKDRPRIGPRHVEDSLRAVACIRSADRTIADLGSGAGLPGIPLAVALPDRRFTLIDPNRRRGGFLEMVVADLALSNVAVAIARVEELPAGEWDLCTARAFAPAPQAWRAAERVLSPTGRLVYFAGAGWNQDRDLRELAAQAISAEICGTKQFIWQGPLVIMGRFVSTDGGQDHEPTQT
jgi:16S rRNA (guanine527-N7)-methyltransferase